MRTRLSEETRTRAVGLAVVATALHAVLLFGLLVVYVSYVPAAKRALDQLGVSLPWMTMTVIRVSNWLAEYWWMMVPVAALVGVIDFVSIWLLGRRLRLAVPVVWTVSVALLFVALGALAVYAMEAPMAKVREGLSK